MLIFNLVLTSEDKCDQDILKSKMYKELKGFFEEYNMSMSIDIICYKAQNFRDFNTLNERYVENNVNVAKNHSSSG